jgi:single-strand selective monofunctional uracil DNA glycosylase
LGAFLGRAARPKIRAFRSNLFCGFAAKKDFRCNPLRTGEQRFCFAKSRPAPCPRASRGLYTRRQNPYAVFMPQTRTDLAQTLIRISRRLAGECENLRFPAAAAVYNPLVYAVKPYELYLRLYGGSPKKVIFLGMNPGPWGMAQTGVPFGEVDAVCGWLGIEAAVRKPEQEHPKRPVSGFACAKSEVSGRRLWGFFRERFETPRAFFRDHFVANYCPLVFMTESGANLTPDKLPGEEAAALFDICGRALADTIRALRPEWVIGVGGFAEKRARAAAALLAGEDSITFRTARILHPSPANPAANAGWGEKAAKTLRSLGVWK